MDPARTSTRQQHSYSAHPPPIADSHRVATPQRNHSPHPHQSYPPPPYQTNGHIISTSPVNNSPVDTRSQHNPPSASYPPHQQHPYSSAPLHPNHYQQPPPPPQGPAQPSRISTNDQPHQLPPYRENIKAETVHNLPGIRPSSRQELGRQQEYPTDQRNGTGHAPTPVDQRSYSQDSRTPLSPSRGPYSAGQAVDGSNTSGKMELHNSYPPQQPLAHHPSHHLPPPQHIQQHHHHQQTQPMGPPPPGPYMNTTPVMEHHPSHHYPVQAVYQQPSHGPATQMPTAQTAGKKRPMRAQQACDQCRQRKQKCDEGDPCSFCRENNHQCHYRDTPPVKIDKNTQLIMSQLEHLVKVANQTVLRDEFEGRLRVLESRLLPQRKEPEGEPESLQEHRTGPHKLLDLWPSMDDLLRDTNTPLAGEWLMSAEDRGIIRIYGKGEGIDEGHSQLSAAPASPAQSEDGSDSGRTPQEGLWGRGFAGTPSSDTSRPIQTDGGMRPDGSLDLDRETIYDLFESFLKHIHVMHPFLDRARLRKLIDAFVQQNNPNSRVRSAGFANEVSQPWKRQRTDYAGNAAKTPVNGEIPEISTRNPLKTERSPENAIVWLILALGKICKHSEPLPGVAKPKQTITNNQANGSFAAFSPAHGNRPSPRSPKSTPIAQTTPSENGVFSEPRSRRSSIDTNVNAQSRNVEFIPGLAYYAKAAEILGDHYDGNELAHAQMFLLAALYKAQLARVKESMSCLAIAGRVCQSLIRQKDLYREGVRRTDAEIADILKDRRSRLILIASWSCLQLESDILAEMNYPSSGLVLLEDELCPMATADYGEDEIFLANPVLTDQDFQQDLVAKMYYLSQLYLRRTLNDAHKKLYGHKLRHTPSESLPGIIQGFADLPDGWRAGLPEALRWDDSEKPANNILAARLRAKYYGAKYVMSRPYLDYAIHIMDAVSQGKSVTEVALKPSKRPRDQTEIMIFEAISTSDPDTIMRNAKQCIEAALHSTIALDGVPTMPNRLIVTNIHGTAHAQFGNMLVLAAAYSNKRMRPHVNEDDFRTKLNRTINFLDKLAPISPTCKLDCSILISVQRKLFSADSKSAANSETGPLSANTSFTT